MLRHRALVTIGTLPAHGNGYAQVGGLNPLYGQAGCTARNPAELLDFPSSTACGALLILPKLQKWAAAAGIHLGVRCSASASVQHQFMVDTPADSRLGLCSDRYCIVLGTRFYWHSR